MERRKKSNKIWGWTAITLTALLLIYLKYLHIGVTHYNIFLLILVGWGSLLVVWFRWLGAAERRDSQS